MNRYTLTGRLTRDPELRTTPSGQSVCHMRIANDELGAKRSTGYIDVAAFGKPAEAAAKVLSQGWLVAVDGRLEHRTWKDAEDRAREGYTVVGHVEFLRAPRNGSQPDDAAAPDPEEVKIGGAADDIEF
jgi:single-strand DNA-binding protein